MSGVGPHAPERSDVTRMCAVLLALRPVAQGDLVRALCALGQVPAHILDSGSTGTGQR